jgi:hypothetical protein
MSSNFLDSKVVMEFLPQVILPYDSKHVAVTYFGVIMAEVHLGLSYI